MGLLIHTTFETAEGLSVTNVYCRITSFTCDIGLQKKIQVILKFETYVSREKKNEGYRRLPTPNLPEYVVFQTPLESGWNCMTSLYEELKIRLGEMGFTTEDVIETPEPAPEPEPEASNTENA